MSPPGGPGPDGAVLGGASTSIGDRPAEARGVGLYPVQSSFSLASPIAELVEKTAGGWGMDRDTFAKWATIHLSEWIDDGRLYYKDGLGWQLRPEK